LRPAAPAARARLKLLIADLSSESFAVRQQALRELEREGELARAVLTAAHQVEKELETRRRIEQLLGKLITLPPELLRALRAVAVLERIGTPAARGVLRSLADGAPEARVTQDALSALKRLQRRP
jgi:hypothetical protein